MKSILVTGAAGFIGCNFVRLALSRGYRVVGFDALTYAGHRENLENLGANFTLVEGDIRSPEKRGRGAGEASSARDPELRRRVARGPLDRGSAPLRGHERDGHGQLAPPSPSNTGKAWRRPNARPSATSRSRPMRSSAASVITASSRRPRRWIPARPIPLPRRAQTTS